MGANCGLADGEHIRNLAVALALGNQLQDLNLALGETQFLGMPQLQAQGGRGDGQGGTLSGCPDARDPGGPDTG